MARIDLDDSASLEKPGYDRNYLKTLQQVQSQFQAAVAKADTINEGKNAFAFSVRTASNFVRTDTNNNSKKGIFVKTKTGKIGLFTGRLKSDLDEHKKHTKDGKDHPPKSSYVKANSGAADFIMSYSEMQLRVEKDFIARPEAPGVFFDVADLIKPDTVSIPIEFYKRNSLGKLVLDKEAYAEAQADGSLTNGKRTFTGEVIVVETTPSPFVSKDAKGAIYFDRSKFDNASPAEIEAFKSKVSVYEFEKIPQDLSKVELLKRMYNTIDQRPFLTEQLEKINETDQGHQFQIREKKPNEAEFSNVKVTVDENGLQTEPDCDNFYIATPPYAFYASRRLAYQLSEQQYKDTLRPCDTGMGYVTMADVKRNEVECSNLIKGMKLIEDFHLKNGHPILIPDEKDDLTGRGTVSPQVMVLMHNVNMLYRLNRLQKNMATDEKVAREQNPNVADKDIEYDKKHAAIVPFLKECHGIEGLCKLKVELKDLVNRSAVPGALTSEESTRLAALKNFDKIFYDPKLRSMDLMQHGPEMGNPLQDVKAVRDFNCDILHLVAGQFTLTNSAQEVKDEVLTREFLESNIVPLHESWLTEWNKAEAAADSQALAHQLDESNTKNGYVDVNGKMALLEQDPNAYRETKEVRANRSRSKSRSDSRSDSSNGQQAPIPEFVGAKDTLKRVKTPTSQPVDPNSMVANQAKNSLRRTVSEDVDRPRSASYVFPRKRSVDLENSYGVTGGRGLPSSLVEENTINIEIRSPTPPDGASPSASPTESGFFNGFASHGDRPSSAGSSRPVTAMTAEAVVSAQRPNLLSTPSGLAAPKQSSRPRSNSLNLEKKTDSNRFGKF